MKVSQRLGIKQTQSPVITPQLQQAIKLLQFSTQELIEYVNQELEQNPLLEAEGETVLEQVHEESDAETKSLDLEDYSDSKDLDTDFNNVWTDDGSVEDGGKTPWKTTNTSYDLDQDITARTAEEISLRDHLIRQINLDFSDQTERMIGVYLVDCLEDSGYLFVDMEELSAQFGCTVEEIERVILKAQHCDPAGVFARNLEECLSLQLKDRGQYTPALGVLLENLSLLADRKFEDLAALCRVSHEQLLQMVTLIKTLKPKPAEDFAKVRDATILPEVFVYTDGKGNWRVELNSEALPKVLANGEYYARLKKTAHKSEEKMYISEKYRTASWLVKSLHQRSVTILSVATEIVKQQEAFLNRGIKYLRPLTLSTIAEALGMHESTISRVTTNKYMATPRGLFEMKYFFSSSITNALGSESHSAESVKYHIKELIEKEDAKSPISDEAIVAILKEQNILIARRTVAKYRESMNIPSSMRRRAK